MEYTSDAKVQGPPWVGLGPSCSSQIPQLSRANILPCRDKDNILAPEHVALTGAPLITLPVFEMGKEQKPTKPDLDAKGHP